MTITNRSTKGSALTYEEMDANLAHLNTLLTEYNDYELDQWYLKGDWRPPTGATAGTIKNHNQATTAYWERLEVGFTKAGTGMAQRYLPYGDNVDDGIFVFPKMGLWRIDARVLVEVKGASNIYIKMNYLDPSDNSHTLAVMQTGLTENGPTNNVIQTLHGTALLNINETPDNDYPRFWLSGSYMEHPLHNGARPMATVHGQGTLHGIETHLVFERKGPPQT